MDLKTRRQTQLHLPGKDLSVNFPTWSPDGKSIGITRYAPGNTQSIWLSASDGSHAEELVAPMNGLQGGPFSPDGKWLFYSADDAGIEQLFVVEIATRKSRQLTTSRNKVVGAWSPDGRWVAYTSNATGNVELWRMPFRKEGRTSDDGRRSGCGTCLPGRTMDLYPAEPPEHLSPPCLRRALQPVTSFPESGLFIEEPTLSPDGRFPGLLPEQWKLVPVALTLGKTAPESK